MAISMCGMKVTITMKPKEDWLNSTMTGSKGLCYNTALLEGQTTGLEASTHSRTYRESCFKRDSEQVRIIILSLM